ncbi:MAG: hypothetical protein AAGE98_16100 [Actinomycetota bacterium]
MSRSRRTIVLIAALFGILATACGGGGSSGPVDSAAAVLVDEFETLDGETIDLASLQGEDVVLWFWAPW